MRTNITIAGFPGTGTSTAGKAVAEALGFEYFSSGEYFRQLNQQRGVQSVDEANRLASSSDEIDSLVDGRLRLMSRQDGRVVDSRTAFHWMPRSFKVRLAADPWIAAERTHRQIQAGERKQDGKTIEEVRTLLIERATGEHERFLAKYGVSIVADAHFDLIVDSGIHGCEEVAKRILEAYGKRAG